MQLLHNDSNLIPHLGVAGNGNKTSESLIVWTVHRVSLINKTFGCFLQQVTTTDHTYKWHTPYLTQSYVQNIAYFRMIHL